ncbi:hypothetical protein [Desulfotomaculum nigrificans]|uniref:hypothetical protein n=1 Tax=Desulfotomaculum nigrificans TaxID=1565 RepID=UPI0001FAE7D2|nr:hypothetical protein [Desulfotomaculum nigrificans]
MKRILSLLFSTLMLLTMFAPRSAMAAEGQLIIRSVISGYYAIYTDGGSKWFANDGEPVTLNQLKTVKLSAGAPFDVSQWDITDIKVSIPNNNSLTNDMFDSSKVDQTKTYVWRDGLTLDKFQLYYLNPTPDGLTVKDTHDLSTGKVDYEYSFYLSPVERAANVRKPDAGYFYDPTWGDIWASKSEAMLWTLPVVIEWYGVQKAAPPPGGTNNPPDNNLPNNLSVKIINSPAQVYSGDPIAVTAEVKNTLKKYVITDFRWKVDGNVVKDYNDFDVISAQGNTYTMTAPNVSKPTTITFAAEVNYNHTKPPTESTWDDNIATCTVTVLPHPEAVSGDLNMWIEAPTAVNNSPLPKSWAFTVWVKPPYIPAPPPPGPDSEPPPPPKLTISVTTTGGLRGDHYEYSTGQQDIVPIEPTYSGTKTVPYEDETPIPFTFTFPWSGVWGQNTQVHIKATGYLTSWCGSWSGQAQKDVKIGEVPIPGYSPILTE